MRPNDLHRCGPTAAARCSFIMNALLDPDFVLYIMDKAVKSFVEKINAQLKKLDSIRKYFDSPKKRRRKINTSMVQDRKIALVQVKESIESFDEDVEFPWTSFSDGHKDLTNFLMLFQASDVLRCANASMLQPFIEYINNDGTDADVNLLQVLLKLPWIDAFKEWKYAGPILPAPPIKKATIRGKTGPFPTTPIDQYSVEIDGYLLPKPWSLPTASSPILYGTANTVKLTLENPALLSFTVQNDPLSSLIIPEQPIIALGKGIIQAEHTEGVKPGNILRVMGANPGDYEIVNVTETQLFCPTFTATGNFTAEIHYGPKFTLIINETAYDVILPLGSSITLATVVNELVTQLPSTGKDAISVVQNGLTVHFETKQTGAKQKLSWDNRFPQAYYWLNITPPGISHGTDKNNVVTFQSYLGTWSLELPPGNYEPKDIANAINALESELYAEVDATGVLKVTVNDYGDWAYLSADNETLKLSGIAWGKSIYPEDTSTIDVTIPPSQETEIQKVKATGTIIPCSFPEITTDWIAYVRTCGEKRWRAYPILEVHATNLTLGRPPVIKGPEDIEIKAVYAPIIVQPQASSIPGNFKLKWLGVGPDILGLDNSSALASTKTIKSPPKAVGRSRIRVGDWLLVPYITIPAQIRQLIDELASKYDQTLAPNYKTWKLPPSAKFPSNYEPFNPQSIPTFEDAEYAISVLKAPCVAIARVKAISSDIIELTNAIPIIYLESKNSMAMPAVFAPSGLPGLIKANDVLKKAVLIFPQRRLPRNEMLIQLNAYRAALTNLQDLNIEASRVESAEGLFSYMDSNNLDELTTSLKQGWFDRFFLSNFGSSTTFAAARVGMETTELVGLTESAPETAEFSLNPNMDKVEYRPDDEDVY